jgi:hypothetical protein
LSVSSSRWPARSATAPAYAIIAALSVQLRAGGTCSVHALLLARPQRGLAEPAVRGHAPREHRVAHALALHREHELAHERVDDGGLHARGEVGEGAPRGHAAALHVHAHGGLQAREAELQVGAGHRPRELNGARISLRRKAIDDGTAGVPEADELGDLVEGLARGVVAGGAELAKSGGAVGAVEGRVAAAREQRDEGERGARTDGLRAVEEGREEVPGEVVHADEGDRPGEAHGLGGLHAHEQRADEARARGHGDGVDGAPSARGLDGLTNHRVHRAEVRAAGDLGDHAAIRRVLGDLRRDDIAQDLARAVGAQAHHRGGGLVAGALHPEHGEAIGSLGHGV